MVHGAFEAVSVDGVVHHIVVRFQTAALHHTQARTNLHGLWGGRGEGGEEGGREGRGGEGGRRGGGREGRRKRQ